jgi:glycosyltransferase involved in cell wall biosynthesis
MNSLNLQILTYNEGKRLKEFLNHATLWAEKIFVVDKGSTDETLVIAKDFNCNIINIPYSEQGMESPTQIFNLIKAQLSPANPWYIWLTPGEIISKNLVNTIKNSSLNSFVDDIDVIYLPIKLYSFGKVRDWGFWRESLQPRLINSNLAKFQDVTHNHVIGTSKSRAIIGDINKFIIHPTHNDFSSFIKSHHDYALSETFGVELIERATVAHQLANKFDHDFFNSKIDDDLRPYYAWKIYCYMVALKSLDSINGEIISKDLNTFLSNFRKFEWGIEE